MPNWCDCELAVRGERAEVDRFMEFAQSERGLLDANNFLPYPEEYAELDRIVHEHDKWANEQVKSMSPSHARQFRIDNRRPKDGYNQGGYNWCIENWGTKWNLYDAEIIDDHEWKGVRTVVYRFDTAWSPPEGVINKMAEMFQELEFELNAYEGAMCFQADGFWIGGAQEYFTYKDYIGPRGG